MKLRAPFKIHGGKFYLSPLIISHFPTNYEKMTYLELFGGAGNVLLNKNPSAIEIYNDLYAPTANIFFHLVNYSKDIIKTIAEIEYSEKSFNNAKKVAFSTNLVSAVAELVLRRMSRGGMKKHFSWSNSDTSFCSSLCYGPYKNIFKSSK
jgi:DNA adenine methylase